MIDVYTVLFALVGIASGTTAGYRFTHQGQLKRIHYCEPSAVLDELKKLELPFAYNTECPMCNNHVDHSETNLLVSMDGEYFEVCNSPECQFAAENYKKAS